MYKTAWSETKFFFDKFRGIAFTGKGYFFRRTVCKKHSAVFSSFRSHVNNIICHLYHIQIMLDNDYRIPLVYQPFKHGHQYADVFKVKSCGRFVKNIDRFPRVAFGKFGSQLHTLALSARKSG